MTFQIQCKLRDVLQNLTGEQPIHQKVLDDILNSGVATATKNNKNNP